MSQLVDATVVSLLVEESWRLHLASQVLLVDKSEPIRIIHLQVAEAVINIGKQRIAKAFPLLVPGCLAVTKINFRD